MDDLYLFILTKKNSFIQLNCRCSKANNSSQVVLWLVQDYRRTYSHFLSGPRHGLWYASKKLFIVPYLQQTFFSFLRATLLPWHSNLFQFSFVNEWMFNLFVSIKPNNHKFSLLIKKVTFQEKRYKIWIFSTTFGFDRSLLKIKQYA